MSTQAIQPTSTANMGELTANAKKNRVVIIDEKHAGPAITALMLAKSVAETNARDFSREVTDADRAVYAARRDALDAVLRQLL